MNDTAQIHYQRLLAPVYAWSVGGADHARSVGADWLATLPLPSPPARALDLGAGFGATTVPLARAGYAVLAVDTSAALLSSLAAVAPRSVATEEADLLALSAAQPPSSWDVILCVGDTLPHLASHDDVEALIGELARILSPRGVIALSYRPSRELAPRDRYVLVRADASRTLIAHLEPIDARHLRVTDLLTERDGERATLETSSYTKLRLEPGWVASRAAAAGLVVSEAPSHRGMTVQLLRRG